MTTLYWLRNDLRLHDNACLNYALSLNKPLLMVYVIDPAQFRVLSSGIRKTGFKRYKFLMDSLIDIRTSLQEKGSNLLILTGKAEVILPELVLKHKSSLLIYQEEITQEELQVENAVKNSLAKTDCKVKSLWGLTLYHKEDIPFSIEDIPLTSKAYRIPVSKNTEVRSCFESPSVFPGNPSVENWGELPKPEFLGFKPNEIINFPLTFSFKGGETEGLNRLNHYTFETELLTTYRWTRNKSLGMDYSSKYSPWMALGCLSPRTIYWQIKKYEEEVKKNASTWWMVFELVWRDYFKFLSMRFGILIFHPGGYKKRTTEWKTDETLFNKWCSGNTGIPFVDAHMRELSITGFMSNRGRVNCSSFLTRDYQIDWRLGASWFENQLLDYDVSSNWLNWSIQAMEIWYTNPVHQGLKYDKDGKYVRHWIPELTKVKGSVIQAPWLLDKTRKEFFEATEYPDPVEIYKKWTRSINNIEKARTDNVLDLFGDE